MTEMTPSVSTRFEPAAEAGTATVKRTAKTIVPGLPAAQGLYDPRNEHDACRFVLLLLCLLCLKESGGGWRH